MRVASLLAAAVLATSVSSRWFGASNIYDTWHESQLERWLDEHRIPFPHPSDRQALLDKVSKNWDSIKPSYASWDTAKLGEWLEVYGLKSKQPSTREQLQSDIKESWDSVADKLADQKNVVFEAWSDSQLKAFLDENKISYENSRESLVGSAYAAFNQLSAHRQNTIDWVFSTWSDSDLKSWLDTHGVPAYQGSARNELIAQLRRKSYLGKLNLMSGYYESEDKINKKMTEAERTLFDKWSDSLLKEYLDERGISVPQGSKRAELEALARRGRYVAEQKAQKGSDEAQKVMQAVKSQMNAATTSAGNAWAGATGAVQDRADAVKEDVFSMWSSSALKEFLDERGVKVPQGSKQNELIALARKHRFDARQQADKHIKAAQAMFEGWSTNDLMAWANDQKIKVSKRAQSNRDELVKEVKKNYATVAESSSDAAAELQDKAKHIKQWAIDTWSDSEISGYLHHFEETVPETRAAAVERAKLYARYWTNGGQPTWSDYVDQAADKVRLLTHHAGQLYNKYVGDSVHRAFVNLRQQV